MHIDRHGLKTPASRRWYRLAGWLMAASLALAACSPSTIPGPTNTPGAPSLIVSTESPSAAVLPVTQTPFEPSAPTETSQPLPQPTATTAQSPVLSTATVPTLPDPASYQWAVVASGLDQPIGLANAGDGSGRLFILEKRGVIVIFQNGALLPQPFLDISGQVNSRGSEQGLLGIAFHPQYKDNGFFYLNYINLSGNTVIARYKVSSDPNRADPGSEKVLLTVRQPFPNHNGGEMAFGPDGYLYIGLGDGGSEGDPLRTAQNLDTLLGKILRIDVDHGDPYAIPPDNPFAKGGGKPEIWAYGLRNPWRFSFDPITGDLYIGDVGQDRWEEIDYIQAGSPGGENFGWSYREGLHAYQGTPPAGVKFVDPVFEYSHDQGCAEIGGEVYRGAQMPAWDGVYLLGDYCSGNVWGLLKLADGGWEWRLLFNTSFAITSFGLAENGDVYLTDFHGDLAVLSVK